MFFKKHSGNGGRPSEVQRELDRQLADAMARTLSSRGETGLTVRRSSPAADARQLVGAAGPAGGFSVDLLDSWCKA